MEEFFTFYNGERPHQSLGHKTPDVVYRTAIGGGALIVDKFAHTMLVDKHHIPPLSIEEGAQTDITKSRRRSIVNKIKGKA